MPRTPVPKPYNSGQWTASRYNSFIKGGLRQASIRWPPKYTVLKAAEVGKRNNKATGRTAMHFVCAHCDLYYPNKQVSVDHITPVVDPAVGFDTWDKTIERMFCEADGLQVLCKGCHDKKTKGEKEIANERRRREKDSK